MHLSTDVHKLWITALLSAGQGEERVDRTVGVGAVGDQATRVEPVLESGNSTASMDPQMFWQVAQEETSDSRWCGPDMRQYSLPTPFSSTWTGTTFTVGVPTMFARDWVSERYVPLIRETLSGVLGRDCEVIITVDPERSPLPEAPPHVPDPTHAYVSESRGWRQRFAALSRIHARRTFVVGNSSRFAHAACRAVAVRHPARRTTRSSSTAAWVSAKHPPDACDRSCGPRGRIATRRSRMSPPRSSCGTRWSPRSCREPAGRNPYALPGR